MPVQSRPGTASLPALPHWEKTPGDLPAAIRQIKAALRARIAASGRTVEEVFAVVEQQMKAEVDEIAAARDRGETIWPVIDYADIEAGTVTAEAPSAAAPARLPGRARPLRPGAGAGLGPRHRRLRRGQPVLRELPRPGRRLLRQRRLQARDLPDLLVAGPDAGPAERPDGAGPALPQPPVEARVRGRAVVRPGPGLAVPGPHPPPPARAPTRPASAPTSTRAPSTCG